MTIQEHFKSDFLVEFSNRGLNSVLEKIIFKLPPRSILACKEVNKAWHQIIIFYCQSSNPRIRKIREEQLEEEWKKKGPIIQKVSLESFGIFQVHCFHMIGDEDHLIVAANFNKTKKAKIIILSTTTIEVLKVLDINSGVDQEVLEIKMSIDKTFLVAYIKTKQAFTESEAYYWVWKRNEDFSLHPLKFAVKPEKCDFLSHHLANIPFLVNGSLFIHREIHPNQIEYDEWNLNRSLKKSKIVSVPTDFLPKMWYTQRDNLSNVAALKETTQGKCVMFGKEGFPYHSILIKEWHYEPFIIGHNSDYLAVLLKSTPTYIREFEFYNYKSGKKLPKIIGMRPLATQLFEHVEVQFSQNHAAIW
jgi:hypothetical protein